MLKSTKLILVGLLVIIIASPASAYVAYETHASFLETVTRDILKLLPRAMGSYIYNNRYDFMRGMTFMTRDVRVDLKNKDLEEIRREAYERLMRDIPFCTEAFKGGELKLDTSATNIAGRLGMIAFSIYLVKIPAFPDVEYLDKFSMALDEIIVENLIDLWLFYDGYGDFHSLGELMERLTPEDMPRFRHVRNDSFAAIMKEDPFVMFRAPDKFNRMMLLTDVDINTVYNNIINDILDAFVFIWKCSGMDLAHPSYAAPPGTIITRASRRAMLSGGVLSRSAPLPARQPELGAPAEEAEAVPGTESAPGERGPEAEPGGGR
ncbi:MAG: hypothetical protein ACLQPD_33165 [Desulfomonilaceae bacterium]